MIFTVAVELNMFFLQYQKLFSCLSLHAVTYRSQRTNVYAIVLKFVIYNKIKNNKYLCNKIYVWYIKHIHTLKLKSYCGCIIFSINIWEDEKCVTYHWSTE